MIITEMITIDGREFMRTTSDGGYMIERDGAKYAEAVDPANSGRTYTETDELIVIIQDIDEQAWKRGEYE